MSFRLAKLRFRRVFRRRRRQIVEVGEQADKQLTLHFFKRIHRLLVVKRFLALWIVPILILIGLTGWQVLALSGYYQHSEPAPGGIYREGIVGQFTNANPIFATSDVDKSVSQLIFSGLFEYNAKNQLVGDLASGYKISKDGKVYTVDLRPNLTWQDGQPLTSADVVFTYHMIQNPLAESPYLASWQGVTVAAKSKLSVSFTLPNPLASFKYSLTNGIIPEHILGKMSPDKLRSASFNTVSPVGTGPFEWGELSVKGDEPGVRQELIALKAFAGYHAGAPKLGGLVIHAYPTTELAEAGLASKDIDGLAGLAESPKGSETAKSTVYELPMTAETLVFFKESSPLLKDANVRKALVLAADRKQIVADLPYPATPEYEPLLPDQLGFDAKYSQQAFDLAAAKKLLAGDGWVAGKDGILEKGGQPLAFNLTVLDSPELLGVAGALKQQWADLGVEVSVDSEPQSEFQSTLTSHSYDAVIDEISVGVDSDEYVYWDGTQADVRSASRLNLSEVKDASIDQAVEAGRTRYDPKIRVIKYNNFLSAWQANVPALVLYQPRFIYVTNGGLYNFDGSREVNNPIGRYNNVADWEVRQQKVTD